MKILLYILIGFTLLAVVSTAILFTLYPLRYRKYINEAAALHNIEPAIIASVINAESGFRRNAVSNKGAVGLMQIMPTTAEWLAGKMDIEFSQEMLKNPRTNILIGTFYLNYLLNKFQDLRTALIAYNAGEGKVITWLTDGRFSTDSNGRSILTSCPYPETNRYVERVLRSMRFYRFRF